MAKPGYLLGVVDPGAMCGCVFVSLTHARWVCLDTPKECLDSALEAFQPEIVIVERWMLYPWMAKKLSFHDFPGPEGIGVALSWCLRNDVPLYRVQARQHKRYLDEVPAAIPVTYHCRDASSLALYWFARQLKLPGPRWDNWRVLVQRRKA